MDSNNRVKKIFIIIGVLVLAIVLFIGGIALTTRYQNTIVSTYDKYYNKYHDEASSYVQQGVDEISKNIELASQENK
jgi:hypothetical protein